MFLRLLVFLWLNLTIQKNSAIKTLLVLHGATASGKTACGIAWAKAWGAEILSCDSRQFYSQMRIGTAAPTEQELSEVPHHFVGFLSVEQAYSAGDYERDVLQFLEGYFRHKPLALLVGGAGLFARAVCNGLDAFPDVPEDLRQALRRDYAQGGLPLLQAELAKSDPEYYAIVDKQNPARLLRALEVCRAAGQPYSSFRTGKTAKRPFRIAQVALHWEREQLYERIDRRVEQMMQSGLLDEVRGLYPYRHLTALQTVGYTELFEYLDGKCGLEQAVERIKQNSRRYAKRQITWMRQQLPPDTLRIDCPIENPEDLRRGVEIWLDQLPAASESEV